MNRSSTSGRPGAVGVVVACAVLGACERPPEVSNAAKPVWTEASDGELSPVQVKQRDAALAAVGDLQKTLLGEVVKGIEQAGPPETIRVCSELAPKLAAEVGERHQVRIGRTSHKLRNPVNQSPEWMEPIVHAQRDETVTFAGPGDAIRLAIPIHIAAPCLMCHGEPGALASGVTAMLHERYPQDEATGFSEGDLRGWFWVESTN